MFCRLGFAVAEGASESGSKPSNRRPALPKISVATKNVIEALATAHTDEPNFWKHFRERIAPVPPT